MRQIIAKQMSNNIVTYDISKIKVSLFSRTC